MARTSNPPTLGPLPFRADMFDQAVTEDGKRVTLGQLTKVWIDWWNGLAARVVRAGGGGLTSAIYFTKTLTADDATLTIPGATSGSIVIVVILEDGTGGWTQTWPAEFIGMASFIQGTAAGTYTSALFYSPDGINFQLIGAPVTGVS